LDVTFVPGDVTDLVFRVVYFFTVTAVSWGALKLFRMLFRQAYMYILVDQMINVIKAAS